MSQFINLKILYLKGYDSKHLIETINTKYSDEKESVLERANRILRGDYLFQNEWDMERTSKIVSMPLNKIDWNYSPTPDLEFSYMLHRHAFLEDVVLAFLYTDDFKYIHFLNEYLIKYIKENPYNDENKIFSWRTIDVALRLMNWIRVNELLHIIGIQLDQSIYETMDNYYNYLIKNLSYDRTQSNWSAIESSAAIVYSVAFNKKGARFEKALKIYEECLQNQVLMDGLQWEQSFMYHHEVLITSLHVLQALGAETPKIIKEKSNDLYQASLKIMRTDGMQTNFGDSDFEDMRSLMLSAHKIINKQGLNLSIESTLFDFMLTGDESSFNVENVNVCVEKNYFGEAGLGIVKDYMANSTFMFSNGPLGGGHGHDDMLHIDWMIDGNNFLIDSGRYTYYEEHGSRLYYKRPHAHNTIIVDDMSYNKHLDSWTSAKVATPMNEKVIFGEKINLFEGGHFGYSDENNMTYVNRKVIYTENNIALIIDSIRSNEKRRLTSNFIFEKNNIEIDDKHVKIENDDLSMYIYTFDDIKIDRKDAIVSYQYNSKFNTERIEFSQRLSNGQTLIFIAPSNVVNIRKKAVYDDSNNLYGDEVVECVSYEIDEIEHYILVQHKEPTDSRRAYKVADKLWYGRVIYFEKNGEDIIYSEKLY